MRNLSVAFLFLSGQVFAQHGPVSPPASVSPIVANSTGKGTIRAPDGLYEGEIKNGKRHGKGVFTFNAGDRYEGDFVDDIMTGRGIVTTKDGSRFEGEVRQGNITNGVLLRPNGTRYDGEFIERRPGGRGILTLADGTRYEGTFRKGLYEGRNIACGATVPNICTRKIFDNAINGRKKSKSKAIFHSFASALRAAGIAETLPGSPLQSIAYMNYFQRPAEESGKSLRVYPRDITEATSVVNEVVSVLEPQLVVFASRLAWRHAKAGLADKLQQAGIHTLDVPHPATSWWNRPSRPMKGKTGRQRLVSAVLTASSNIMVLPLDRNTSTID